MINPIVEYECSQSALYHSSKIYEGLKVSIRYWCQWLELTYASSPLSTFLSFSLSKISALARQSVSIRLCNLPWTDFSVICSGMNLKAGVSTIIHNQGGHSTPVYRVIDSTFDCLEKPSEVFSVDVVDITRSTRKSNFPRVVEKIHIRWIIFDEGRMLSIPTWFIPRIIMVPTRNLVAVVSL